MRQTEQTAIVLRSANYRDNDRMLTLLSPTKGLMDVLSRGCRRPRSPLLNASEIFSLGDYELYMKGSHMTVVSVRVIETFFPLRNDFERLTCGTYLLNLCELTVQPGEPCQELFMLLLHTLSRLTFSDQPWRPLLTGFLTHYAVMEGFRPRLAHCLRCGRALTEEEPVFFDPEGGGTVCTACGKEESQQGRLSPLPPSKRRWLSACLQSDASGWVDTETAAAPYPLMRRYVEGRLESLPRSAPILPER